MRFEILSYEMETERWTAVSCPLYQDFTRTCISKFPDFLEFPTLDLCESDEYNGCIAHLIFTSTFMCRYLTDCGNAYKKKVPKLITKMLGEKETRELFYRFSAQYCISQENHRNCAKYKLLAEGRVPPINLFPDGSKSSLVDVLLKRNLIAHPPE
jgi:hypothetical protein